MKKFLLLMLAVTALFAGCKGSKSEAPLSEQIIGKWTAVEYLDPVTDTYKSVVGTPFAGYFAQLNANKTFVTNQVSGTYNLIDETIVCVFGVDEPMHITIVEIKGDSAIADLETVAMAVRLKITRK